MKGQEGILFFNNAFYVWIHCDGGYLVVIPEGYENVWAR